MSCPQSQAFNYKVNMICITEHAEDVSVFVFCLNIVVFVLLIKLAIKSQGYLQKVTEPKPHHVSYNETYCVHSEYIVRWTQVLILVSMWSCLFNAFTCIIGTKYRDWFLTQAFKDCQPNPHWSEIMTNWEVVDTIILYFSYNLRYALVLL